MRNRNGLTLIELLVTIGILGLLASVLLPAVQSSRAEADRLQCVNNLRQVGMALHSYETDWGMFPPDPMVFGLPRQGPSRQKGISYFSAQTALLRQLDLESLYDAINFSVPTSYPTGITLAGANVTAATQLVGVFLCPSDRGAWSGSYGPNNYRANAGICGYCRSGVEDGAFTRGGTRTAEFVDGLSSTLAFSEKLIGGVSPGTFIPNRDWIYAFRIVDVSSMSADDWVEYCAERSFPADLVATRFDAGRLWILGGTVYTQFLVSAPPNSKVPDCGKRSVSGIGVFAARSLHASGVNALLADGSARIFKNGINVQIWRALGTRRGSEIMNEF